MNEPEIKPETIITCSKDHLDKLFREAKSEDLTRAQFEREKTERIKAFTAALNSSVRHYDDQILKWLREAAESKYPETWR